ncbi:choice-of-anchor J domain-containing protein [Ichthyenterobacterium sp. W332]|uniref:Choice-of-anchor J domain-containing protein n=1 Tax=Microcosmobacter mediterraneus TaxID=3075607 RepID=A0ABU2YHZ4_9FLAO|nr:choice-of-anchor J domain-containing protein [Ichthyenterobacterium sp. W332]MDT0557794.1 choice-of-anchor J domain-containing protein [Ichthyenterobacterium sp. W332]
MKKIVYLLTIVAIVITACNPMEDIYNEISEIENPVIGTDEFTMTADDYAEIDSSTDDDYYETFEAFADLDDAKNALPSFIADRYPFWGNGSAVTVSFDVYDGNPGDLLSPFTNADVYLLGSNDYPSSNSNAFLEGEDVESTLEDVIADQFPMPSDGQVVRLGYNSFTEAPTVGLASVYEAAFPANFGDFEFIEVFDDGLEGDADNLGWRNQSAYAEGSGFAGGANQTEEWLISPEVDLTGSTGLSFQITQEIDFLGDEDLFDVLVSTDYTTGGDPMAATWEAVDFDKTIFGSMTTSEDLDFEDYDGETVHIALKYSSTDSDSPRWRVESFAVRTIGFEGPTESNSAYYTYFDGSWSSNDNAYYLADADYDLMGAPGQFNNFSNSVRPENYIPQFLGMQFPFAQEEDELYMIYRFFAGSTVTRGNLYTFTNGAWTPAISSLQFGNENGVWVPDNTIRYTLVGTDYSVVVNGLTGVEGFEAAVGNLDTFGNFNRTGGSTNWSDDMLLAAFNLVLDNINPSAEEGQKYFVTIATWAPGNSTEDFALIKADGVWVYQ